VSGNPFVHVELLTNDVEKAKDFYTKLFDWKLEEIPGMDYTLIEVGEGTGGGMMRNPMPESPSRWLDHDQRRHADLLQGLGHGAARRLQPRLAAQRRRLGKPDGLPGLQRLPLHRP
jgi:catechol 2,3-dioxygenase-like lactoylglutathione lyase family enzyme